MLTSILAPQRKCGECKACCTAIAVKELGKPFMTRCEHESPKGCAIYSTRPDNCAGYECGWMIGFGQVDHRPDKIGGLIHHETDSEGLWVQIHLLREVTPAEFQTLMDTAEICFKIAQLRGIKLVRHDQVQNCGFHPDQDKYPGTKNVPGDTVWETRDGIHYKLRSRKRVSLRVL